LGTIKGEGVENLILILPGNTESATKIRIMIQLREFVGERKEAGSPNGYSLTTAPKYVEIM